VTGRRRTAGKSGKPRICAECGIYLAGKRPVYLCATSAGTIIGPYHSGCAARVAWREKGHATPAQQLGGEVYGQFILPREETLPW